jgi:hypothetical protein
MPRQLIFLHLGAAVAATSCTGGEHAARGRRCEREGTDSARAACVAVEAASRRAGVAQRVHEFRWEPGGYSILTVPVKLRGTDGEVTVHVSHAFEVTSFGPDSA